VSTGSSSVSELSTAFRRLDGVLARAVALAQTTYESGAATDPYRGLHIRPEEVSRLLSQPPGRPLLWAHPYPPAAEGEGSRLAALATSFDLDPFDPSSTAVKI